jgi:hypothetical protein
MLERWSQCRPYSARRLTWRLSRDNGVCVDKAILLAPGAEDNGFAVMLSDLVRQNLETNPHKRADFDKISGSVAIVAEDAEVAITLRFSFGKLTVYDGIVGIPDVTIRGTSDIIMAMSNMPSTTRLGLPIAKRGDKEGQELVASVVRAFRTGAFHIHGGLFHTPLLMRFSRVMSIHG